MIEPDILIWLIMFVIGLSAVGLFIPLFSLVALGIVMFTLIPPPLTTEPFYIEITIITILVVIIMAIVSFARKLDKI